MEQRSPGGGLILQHDRVQVADSPLAYADDARLTAHLDRTLGGTGMVFHEIVSDRIHLDVHLYGPTPDRPNNVLVTSGMSALPMRVPPGNENWSFAELCILLPSDWPLTTQAFDDPRHYWPIRLLKDLGRLPHLYGTWLGWGHSVPNGDPARPYAEGTDMAGAIVVPPFGLGGTEVFVVPGEPRLHLFQVLPVTAAEMDLKLAIGLDATLDRFESSLDDPYGPIDPRRPSVA